MESCLTMEREATLHRMTLPLPSEEATSVPSLLNATLLTDAMWPCRTASCVDEVGGL